MLRRIGAGSRWAGPPSYPDPREGGVSSRLASGTVPPAGVRIRAASPSRGIASSSRSRGGPAVAVAQPSGPTTLMSATAHCPEPPSSDARPRRGSGIRPSGGI